jgi:SAM-dependent methyltransferase
MNSNISVFDAYGRYYDLLYQDKDYSGEVSYIDRTLQRHGATGVEILELGSGTGKHGRMLAKRGYRVHGIERSAEMVAQAIQCEGFTSQVGDICKTQLGRTFDVVLSLFHVVSYQIENQAICDLFARAAEHLKGDGLFIFDTWYSPAVYDQKPVVRIKRIKEREIEVTRIAEPQIFCNENRVDVTYTIFVRNTLANSVEALTEVHPMRHFSIPEIDMLAKAYGFERVIAQEFVTEAVPSEKTWGVCFVLRKLTA